MISKELKQITKEFEQSNIFLDRIFDLFPGNVALLDLRGRIVMVNQAWIDFGVANGLEKGYPWLGTDYLAVCRNTLPKNSESAQQAHDGIMAVLGGDEKYFELEYPCHSPEEKCWFQMRVSPTKMVDQLWAVVAHVEITERKKLQGERDRILNLSRDLICIAGMDGYFKYLNPAWEQITDYPPEELLAKPFLEFIHPDDRDRIGAEIKNLAAGMQTIDFEHRYVHKDGSVRYLSWIATPVPEDQVMYCIGRDITGRKQVEQALRERRQRLNKAEQVARMGFLDWDLKTNEIEWSDEVYELYGINPKAPVTIEHTVGLVHPDDREFVDENLNLAIQGLQDYKIDHRMVRPDGRVIWVQARADLERDEKGKPARLLGTVVDITERKQTEKAMHEHEATLEALLNSPLDTVLLINPDGKIMIINESGARRLDSTPEELNGRNLYEVFPPEVARSRENFIRQVFDTGEPVYFEDSRAGIQFATNIYPIFNEDSEKVKNVAIFATDISERVQANQQIQDYQQRLRSLASQLTLAEERERRRIAGELHDQISQTLAFARLQLGSARKGSSDTEQIAILDDISQALLQVIQDTSNLIFDLSPPLLTEIGLEAAISEWLENQIGKKHGLTTKLIEDGPPLSLDKDLSILLFRCVRELLTNVIRHAEATKVTVQIQRSIASATVIVEDNGIGFKTKLNYGSGQSEGGFGLFNIHERMNDLGGSFEIDSEPGLGCRAILITPIK